MIKFFCCIAILAGAFLLGHQWGTIEKSMETAQLLADLVTAYGTAYGKTLSWAYLYLPIVGIAVGILGIVADCRHGSA